MKFKIKYNEKPLRKMLTSWLDIIIAIEFKDEEKEYKVFKKSAFPMTITTDAFEPLKNAAFDMAKCVGTYLKEINRPEPPKEN
jgi:hypothetical protein